MRIAVIIVAMSVVTASSATPSEASQACMSKAEARQQFASVHIYWHGRGHCWDATPAQRHRIGRIKRKTPVHEAERKAVQPGIEQPEWRNSRSEMLADDEPAQLPPPPQGTRSDGNEKAGTGTPWALRWVDVEPTLVGARAVATAPAPPAFTEQREAEPLITLHGVVFMCIAFVLTLGTIKMMVLALIHERRRAKSNSRIGVAPGWVEPLRVAGRMQQGVRRAQ
jgi:hypothetical protein